MFLLSEDTWSLIILGICIIPILILMLYAITVAIRNAGRKAEKREEEIRTDEDDTQRELFMKVYGGEDNIESVDRELSRISVKVKDIEKVSSEELKNLGANGVLLVNDVVKCSFGDRAPYIYRLLVKKEGKNEQ